MKQYALVDDTVPMSFCFFKLYGRINLSSALSGTMSSHCPPMVPCAVSLSRVSGRAIATCRGRGAGQRWLTGSGSDDMTSRVPRRIMARDRTPRTLLRVEIVGAKALKSANFWAQGLSPACKIRMGVCACERVWVRE